MSLFLELLPPPASVQSTPPPFGVIPVPSHPSQMAQPSALRKPLVRADLAPDHPEEDGPDEERVGDLLVIRGPGVAQQRGGALKYLWCEGRRNAGTPRQTNGSHSV